MDSTDNAKRILLSMHPLLWWLATTILCVVLALTHCYSLMATYDDESYVMMTIKTFLEGDRLYGETYTQYGPAYYMIQQPIHGWLNVPITHDIVRLKTVASWTLIGVLSGLVVMRITRLPMAGLLAMLISVLHLQKLGLEPAHPQELVALLALLSLLLLDSKLGWILFLAGACAGLTGMTKLNVGATAAAACLFAASAIHIDSRRLNKLGFLLGCFIACGLSLTLCLPIILKNIANGQWSAIAWPVTILVSCISVCVVTWRRREILTAVQEQHEIIHLWRHPLVLIAAGGLSSAFAVMAWAILHGNSIDELLYGVVLQHAFMKDSFYHPITPTWQSLPFVVIAAMFCWFHVCHPNWNDRRPAVATAIAFVPPVVLGYSLLLISIDCWKPLQHGLLARGAEMLLISSGPLLMPALLMQKFSPLRLGLAMSGCLTPLIAFPVPGTQVALGTLPVLLGLVIATVDVFETKVALPQFTPKLFQRTTLCIAVLMIALTTVSGLRWANNQGLAQPGCRWVRIEPNRAEEEIAVANRIRETESPWLAFDTHNHNRFFFWTGKQPLTSTNPTFWTHMLTQAQQARVEAAAKSADSICVVKLTDSPIEVDKLAPGVGYELLKTWKMIDQVGAWQIGIRRR